jgi:epoxyqueuosine reductase QueG
VAHALQALAEERRAPRALERSALALLLDCRELFLRARQRKLVHTLPYTTVMSRLLRQGTPLRSPVDAAEVKRRARELGADLCGIASAATLNAFPPDPRWPQTPDRISPYCKSVVVIVQRIPVGAFRCKSSIPVQYLDMLVLRRMDRAALKLAQELERAGHPAFALAAQETDWNLKRASYARLSTRHLGVEAGLGTLGLEVNILTPEFGPRLYLTGILTEVELEPDRRMEEQVCIGESCSRCLHSCPPDAVRQWGLDKVSCATEAQEFGYAQITRFFDKFLDMEKEDRAKAVQSRDVFGFWQGLLRVVGSFGDCPRCLAVCPVGNDYHAHLADIQKQIPEKTPEKAAKAAAFKQARKSAQDIPGLSAWNRRWVGEKGYQGIVARQLQEFKRLQKEKEKQ